jgi:CCR4-NOT transcription complex subunit 6
MSEPESMQVDGCAIFYRTSKFLFVDQYLVEFNQMAMAYSEGADDMLNRVMPKDNIAILALLEVKEVGVLHQDQRQHIMVSNSHIHWDPELRDVKLIQSMLLVNEIHQIMKQVATERGIGMQTSSTGEMLPKGLNIPLIMCCDLNSLPDSGVVEYLTTGRVASDHPDFQSLKYQGFLQRFMDKKVSPTSSGNVSHPFNLSSVYLGNELPFTNFTYDFTGIIDYIMYTKDLLSPLGLLGKISEEWLTQNKIIAYPHPHFSSDHIPLLTEVEIVADQRR